MSLSKIETEISQLREQIANLMNQKVSIKFLDTLDLQESELQKTSDITVHTELQEITSPDEYNVACSLLVTYKYTTTYDVVVNVEFTAKYSEKQTYTSGYAPVIDCITHCTVYEDNTILQNMSKFSKKDLDYDKSKGCYLHIVNAIYHNKVVVSELDQSMWWCYIRHLRQ